MRMKETRDGGSWVRAREMKGGGGARNFVGLVHNNDKV